MENNQRPVLQIGQYHVVIPRDDFLVETEDGGLTAVVEVCKLIDDKLVSVPDSELTDADKEMIGEFITQVIEQGLAAIKEIDNVEDQSS